MLAQPDGLADDEDDHQAHQAEGLEADPLGFGEMPRERHVEVDGAGEQEEAGPDQVELVPGGVRQLDLLFHQAPDQVAAEQ